MKKITKFILILSTLLILFSCVGTDATSKFNLRTDLFHFTERMSERDTLTILANLSNCMFTGREKNILTKKGGEIFIKSFYSGGFGEIKKQDLGIVKYVYSKSDSLNFENLFRFIQAKKVKDEKINGEVLTIIYKQDTIRYFSSHLGDHLSNLSYYIKIKRRLYPNAEVYKTSEN